MSERLELRARGGELRRSARATVGLEPASRSLALRRARRESCASRWAATIACCWAAASSAEVGFDLGAERLRLLLGAGDPAS